MVLEEQVHWAPELATAGPGRRFVASRRVRLSDVTPAGRVRLDAVARYLQDIAADDVNDAGVAEESTWVVRRTTLVVQEWPHYQDSVELATWCSGVGAAWAERRTTISGTGTGGPAIEAACLWVSLDPRTLRPAAPTGRFLAVYQASAGGRRVTSRLTHPLPGESPARPLHLRLGDFDVLGHVNNAVSWGLLEDELSRRCPGLTVRAAEVEYRDPVEWGAQVALCATSCPGGEVRMWVTDPAGRVLVSARAALAPAGPFWGDPRASLGGR